MGRNLKVYKYLGDTLVGLSKIGPNRWRISQTGERFTESDEFKAVAYFKQVLGGGNRSRFIAEVETDAQSVRENMDLIKASGRVPVPTKDKRWHVGVHVDDDAFWAEVRDLILNAPDLVAQKTGIPQMATVASLQLPKDAISCQSIADTYREFSTAKTNNTKKTALKAWERLVTFCDAKVLSQLTTEKLLAFSDAIARDTSLTTGETKRAYIRRPKTVLAFGLKRGLDPTQIRATLDRMAVLDVKRFPKKYRPPSPISREDFQTLLNAAVDDKAEWRMRLLLGLNLCLHIKATCDLRWESFDLLNGTYATIREKTEEERIPQAAVLWTETLEEIGKLQRTGNPYLILSRYGDRYTKQGMSNAFRRFADSLGLKKVQWDHIRDGAYTAAMNGAEEKWARVLAGHRAPGLLDNYVMRNADKVKPACDAVHRAYFG